MKILDAHMTSDTSSLKILKENISAPGSFITPAGNNVSNSATIPHGYGSDVLIWQVSIVDGSTGQAYITPFYSPDSRYDLHADLDETNLYIYVNLTSAGAAYPAITWTYYYRILIP